MGLVAVHSASTLFKQAAEAAARGGAAGLRFRPHCAAATPIMADLNGGGALPARLFNLRDRVQAPPPLAWNLRSPWSKSPSSDTSLGGARACALPPRAGRCHAAIGRSPPVRIGDRLHR